MDKFYKIGNTIVSEGNVRTSSRIDTDGQFIVFTHYKIDAGSPENAKRALDAIARVIGAEDLLASDADEGGAEKPATAEPDAEGWIQWGGGECPFPEGTRVDVRHRDGYQFLGSAVGQSHGCRKWHHTGSCNDIVAYRLVPEAPDTAELGAEGWIPWAGGECPVDEDDDVAYRLRNGHMDSDAAGMLDWRHTSMGYDIVAYRLVEEKACETR